LKIGREADRTRATLQTPVGRYLTRLTDLENLRYCYSRQRGPIS
jgi:hypothetical protein